MPLTIYADILVIVNLYIDFFLLWCVKKFLRLRVKNRRLALGALTGAFCSLSALLPGLPGWVSLLSGVCCALAVTGAALAPISPGMFFRAALCFWAFTLLLAGFFLFLLRFFAPGHVAVLGNVIYFDLSLPLLFFFTCGAYFLFSLTQRLLSSGSNGLRCQWIAVKNNGETVKLYVKADTGNALREPFSGLPVLVCQAESLGKTVPPELSAFFTDKAPALSESPGALRLIPFESVGGAGILPAFRPERVTVVKTEQELSCYIAVSGQKLSAGQFDALYNPDLFPELREHC